MFTPKGEWKPLSLDSVSARLFSEAMRDLNLAVSVAHRGVNREATASTVDARGAAPRDVRVLWSRQRGNTGEPRNHPGDAWRLFRSPGSAGAMVLSGTAPPIVTVHPHHRGPLFLPFADDDPRTAEVLSKVLLLARNRELRNPNILEWIHAPIHHKCTQSG